MVNQLLLYTEDRAVPVRLGVASVTPGADAGKAVAIRRLDRLRNWRHICPSHPINIHLLDEWDACDRPDPRMDAFRWMIPIVRLFKIAHIYHFQLGKVAG